MADRKLTRCAIYTRKSTEHGLEQDFNSLDAQREACAAYVKSQAHEGWKSLPAQYNDGGISGGTLERPALQALLDEVKSRKIDVIVVYKIDRLTRSLADFAKLVELFDAHNVSFVSVTQQFNTTTSMGRLTLNVLLSFAQFEREVTAERIRDKVAASRQRGLWMGGTVPLGYVVENKKLMVHLEEAEQVRFIFKRYMEMKGMHHLRRDLAAKGFVTKARVGSDGNKTGGIPFQLGTLWYLLRNRLYAGEAKHKGKFYPGDHEAIIDPELFKAVQEKLKSTAVTYKNTRGKTKLLLMGRIFDEAGIKLSATYTQKKNTRYYYYASTIASQDKNPDSMLRIPAPQIDKLVADAVRSKVGAEAEMSDAEVINRHVDRVVASTDRVAIELRGDSERHVVPPRIELPFMIRKRGRPRREIVRNKEVTSDPNIGMSVENHRRLVATIARAKLWAEQLASGAISLAALAAQEQCAERHVNRLLPLAFLAPDIVVAALENRLPPHLVMTKLAQDLPLLWSDQRQIPGIAPVSLSTN